MNPRDPGAAVFPVRAAALLAALASLDPGVGYAFAADGDPWQGTVTVVAKSRSESDKTDVSRPDGGGEECSFSQRRVSRTGDQKTTTYSDFRLLPDREADGTGWLGSARANVTVNNSYYSLDVRKYAQCGVLSPPRTEEEGYETTTSGAGVGQGKVRFSRYAEPGSRRATCHIEADVEQEVAKVPEIGRRWNSKGEESVREQSSLHAGSISNFSFACDPQSSSYSGQRQQQTSSNVNDTEVVTWNIRRGPGKAAAVTIDGCAHLGMGKAATLTAKGSPPGGTYKWYGMPMSVLEVTEAGPEVTVTPLKAGRALIQVEYTPPGGGVAEATLSGSVAEVRSVNGGAALPEIGLKDENGHTPPPVRVPVDQAPPEGDLVSYPVADPAVANVLNEGRSLLIQGVRVGKTTAQAQTACKLKTGPEFSIEVVRCTKETREKQFEKEKEAQRKIIEDSEKAREALEGEKLEEAAKKLTEHSVDAFAKLSELLLSLTSGAGHGKAESLEHGLEAAGKLYTAWKMMQGNTEASAVLLALINPSTKKVAAKYELYESWKEYLHDLDTILSALEKWHEAMQRVARDREELDLLQRRHASICGKKPGDGEPPPAPTPPGRTPAPTVTPAPAVTPVPQEPTPAPPVPTAVPPKPTGVPPGATPPRGPPPQPTAPPATAGGMPYLACGCQPYTTSAWTISVAGVTAVGADLTKTQPCAKEFAGRVETLGNDLQSFGDAFTQAQQAAGLPREAGLAKLGSAIEVMKKSLSGITAFGKDAETLKSSLGGCEGSFRKAGDLIMKAPGLGMNETRVPEARPGRK